MSDGPLAKRQQVEDPNRIWELDSNLGDLTGVSRREFLDGFRKTVQPERQAVARLAAQNIQLQPRFRNLQLRYFKASHTSPIEVVAN